MLPWPSQRGQVMCEASSKEGRNLCLESSSKPKRDILPTCTLARSSAKASRSLASTSRCALVFSISIKSITTKPPRSLRRICLAISSAASRLVCLAVASISAPLVERAELISIETKASV